MADIPIRYNPKETEDKWYSYWEEKNYFAAKPQPDKKPFCIVIPPPNVTGILHMGHALNNTIQDILIRYHRMKGEASLWMPGTDHAGIATQNVVEKQLAKEGLKRQDLGREKFIERVWQWREEYGSTIIRQLKKLGASCDWPRTRFTMDEGYSDSVKEVFIRLCEKGLIYRGRYMINWCPRCQTALSDEETVHHEIEGNLYYIKYPLKQLSAKSKTIDHRPSTIDHVVVATTRPETMLGDTAVAVNPKDKRYKKLIGKTLILPLLNRQIKIIADNMVDMEFGTGAVKVTPAHDPNDYALGIKHKLEFINVMYPDARMNNNAGDYKDMDRFEAREAIIEGLRERKLLKDVKPHKHAVGHCYRCHTIVESYLSWQWFVRMKPLAKPAITVIKNSKIQFYPKRWTKVYLNWMGNIRDWCISRQIWWGHRLPVWYCECYKAEDIPQPSLIKFGDQAGGERPHEKGAWVTIGAKGEGIGERIGRKTPGLIISKDRPEKCPDCGSANIRQDEDVLDTWFSSWLWPFATFGWPFGQRGLSPKGTVPFASRDLDYFYPTSVLVTAPEIIFFWVARMVMAGLEFMKEVPFRDVYIHGTVRDIEGKKMSKSLGNIIDPLDIINEYGADALRFSLISITAQGQDVFLSKERFEQGRNFANKIWNASRFIMMNLEQQQGLSPQGTVPAQTDLCVFFKKEDLDIVNRWILSRFYSMLKELEKNLAAYKFNEAANLLYGFFWHEFCDWYIELAKPALVNSPQSTVHRNTQVVMYKVLEKFLRILHPFMPFITEEIWQRLQGFLPKGAVPANSSIMVETWPHIQEQVIDKKAESQVNGLIELITAIRNIRQELEIPAQDKINARIFIASCQHKDLLQKMAGHIRKLAGVEELSFARGYKKSAGTFETVLKDMHIVIPLSGATDARKHKHRLQEKISRLEAEIKSKEKLLSNDGFIKKAPGEIIESEKAKLKELRERFKKMEAIKDGFR